MELNSSKKVQNNYFQLIKGISIVAVIAIHTISFSDIEINNNISIILRTILNFAVATFIFLSGYFFSIKYLKFFKNYLFNRLSKLLISFWFWSIVMYTITFILTKKINLPHDIIEILFGLTSEPLYFILVLVQLTVITKFLYNSIEFKSKRTIILLITPIYLLTGFILNLLNINIPYYGTMIFAWVSYYYLGLIYQKYETNIRKKIQNIRKLECKVGLCLLILVAINIILYNLNFLKFDFVTSQLNPLNMIYVSGIILFIIKNKDNLSNKIMSKIGDISLGIYYLHPVVLIIVNRYVTTEIYLLNVILKTSFTLMISYLMIIVTKKILGEKISSKIGF